MHNWIQFQAKLSGLLGAIKALTGTWTFKIPVGRLLFSHLNSRPLSPWPFLYKKVRIIIRPLLKMNGKSCLSSHLLEHYYRPKRSFGQGNIFTPVCHSVHRGRGSPSPGGFSLPEPHRHGEPPQWRTPPSRHPLGWRTHPPDGEHPPRDGEPTPPPPPRKQTPAYGLWSAGTHPTGMHSCSQSYSIHGKDNNAQNNRALSSVAKTYFTFISSDEI